MYNGIGLTTPRGSGTSGYVVRNLSSLRVHERINDKSAWDTAPPKHREPDEAILEHERKRKVEIKCFELRDELEDRGIDEDEIENQVDQLRQKLLANLSATALPSRGFKPSDTHAMAAAKKTELSKMARALGTRPDYQEGDAFDREKQEEYRIKRIAEREQREKVKRDNQARMAEQKAKWEKERKEQDKLRRKEGEKQTQERGGLQGESRTSAMPPPPLPTGPRGGYRDRDRPSEQEYRSQPPRNPPRRPSPPPRDDYAHGGREVRRTVPPSAPRGGLVNARAKRERSPSRSRSPPPRNRRRVDSRAPSRSLSRSRSPWSRSRSSSPMGIVAPSGVPGRPPPPAQPRGGGRGRGRSPSRSPSRSPPHRRRPSSRSLSRSSRSRSPSGSPPRRQTYRSGTPPPPSRHERIASQVPTPHGGTRTSGPPRGRSRSVSTGSSMSVSTRSGGDRSRSRSRD